MHPLGTVQTLHILIDSHILNDSPIIVLGQSFWVFVCWW